MACTGIVQNLGKEEMVIVTQAWERNRAFLCLYGAYGGPCWSLPQRHQTSRQPLDLQHVLRARKRSLHCGSVGRMVHDVVLLSGVTVSAGINGTFSSVELGRAVELRNVVWEAVPGSESQKPKLPGPRGEACPPKRHIESWRCQPKEMELRLRRNGWTWEMAEHVVEGRGATDLVLCLQSSGNPFRTRTQVLRAIAS